MTELYWICLVGGSLFSLATFLLSDLLHFHHGMDVPGVDVGHDGLQFGEVLHPVVLVGGVTVFGAAGIIIDSIADYDPLPEAALALLFAVCISIALYFLYVKPMRNRENSVGYSMRELPGRIGVVSTAIPASGYGEIMLTIAGSNTCQIAASVDGRPIREGERIVVVEAKDDTVLVVLLDETDALQRHGDTDR